MSDQTATGVDLPTLYRVLRDTARNRRSTTFTYAFLSAAYEARTQVHFDPHGTWDMPLDAINKRLEQVGLPPLSSVVVMQDTGMPGGGFWDTCARTRNVSRNADERLFEYARILAEVQEIDWPAELP
ncbi:MAG: hypothetical protein JWL77_3521 [Chthonomonadaceae bacterium]|nr:hypothetical protein [Chthonomonadaceae bacterium]